MLKFIPNLITLLNLFSGCIALVLILYGQTVEATVFVAISLIFDFADGFAARLLKAQSEIGKQLDSLADVVSFGVVPGAVMFTLLQKSIEVAGYTFSFASYLPFLGFIITLFSALRLAKFNIDERQSSVFYGLPTPANTMWVVSIPLIISQLQTNNSEFLQLARQSFQNPWFLLGLVVLSSYLLVSEIKLFALKFKSFSWSANVKRYTFLGLSLMLLIVLRFAAIPLIIFIYILMSVLIKEPEV